MVPSDFECFLAILIDFERFQAILELCGAKYIEPGGGNIEPLAHGALTIDNSIVPKSLP